MFIWTNSWKLFYLTGTISLPKEKLQTLLLFIHLFPITETSWLLCSTCDVFLISWVNIFSWPFWLFWKLLRGGNEHRDEHTGAPRHFSPHYGGRRWENPSTPQPFAIRSSVYASFSFKWPLGWLLLHGDIFG